MERKVKVIVFIIFVCLIIFLIFYNIRSVEEAERSLPNNEELNEFSNVQSKSEANSYEVKDIPDKELSTIYYNHFKNLVVNDSAEAYKRIRNKDEVSEEVFNTFRDDIINNYYSNKVSDYSIGGSTYKITTNNNQTITFYVDAVFKYEIELLL